MIHKSCGSLFKELIEIASFFIHKTNLNYNLWHEIVHTNQIINIRYYNFKQQLRYVQNRLHRIFCESS